MANALYSIVSAQNHTINTLVSKLDNLEKQLLHTGDAVSVANVHQQSNRSVAVEPGIDITPLQKRLDSVEQTIVHLKDVIKTLTDDVKNAKSIAFQVKEEIVKDRGLLETTVTHKLEAHMNRFIREKLDASASDTFKKTTQYTEDIASQLTGKLQELSQEVKDLSNLQNKLVATQTVAPTQPVTQEPDASVLSPAASVPVDMTNMTNMTNIDELTQSLTQNMSLGDVDFEFNTSSTSNKKKGIRKKN
jgi:chromosome segregation ATPase